MVISDGNPDGGVWQEELTLAGEDLLLFFLCDTSIILHAAGNARKKRAVIYSTL